VPETKSSLGIAAKNILSATRIEVLEVLPTATANVVRLHGIWMIEYHPPGADGMLSSKWAIDFEEAAAAV
jgi:hypothetical protein